MDESSPNFSTFQFDEAKKYADIQIDKWTEKVKHLSFRVEQKVDDIVQDTVKWHIAGDIEKIPLKLGHIMTYDDDKIPLGFLPRDGSMLRRDDHSDLFIVIKTKYADGSNTAFNLPLMTSETQGIHHIICVASNLQKN